MAIRPPLNETELLIRISEGEEHAFTELFKWYYNPIGEFVLKLVGSVDIAEEIVQDCFIKIWLKKDTLPAILNFSSYLFIVCRNQTFLVLKKMAAEKVFQADFEKYILEESETDDLEKPIEAYRTMIDEAVAKLPPRQQKAYMLSRYQRLKHEEIAKELNLSAETVKKHIQLAVQFIKKDVGARINPSLVVVLTSIMIFK